MIEAAGLTHHYGTQAAVQDLCLKIEAGDAFGFIGPNGAGKTTTIRILATLLEPTEGEAFVAGYSVRDDPEEVRRIMGFMPDQFGLYDGLLVWEYLDLFAELYRIPRARRQRLIGDVLELTDLTAKRGAFTEHLSKGMRQRLCLAKTLLHDPKVLILDEPASGLDPRARAELKELMRELRRMGKTILVSSHILPELADFCNRVGILEAGRLVACGTLEEVLGRAGAETVDLRVLGNPEEAARILNQAEGVSDVQALEEGGFRFRLMGGAAESARLLKLLVEGGVEPCMLAPQKADLEAAFLQLTQGVGEE
ncbi:MAG: ABC transporter ATP-binding protein [Candidatus Eremiobacterota bacterium]